ncbi:type II CAAX endopeptidase family protein [Fodinicola feengrottensis]
MGWSRARSLSWRRRVVAGTAIAGTTLLGVSLSTKPGSPRFYGLTGAVAAVWLAGGLASGPLHRGRTVRGGGRPVVGPVLLGVGAFGAFYAAALVARPIPPLRDAIAGILQYAHEGTSPLVLFTTLANGAAEETFFRGAVFAAAGDRAPVTVTTAVYTLATTATGNPALVLASIPMGALFALQRRGTGGIQAPLITHLTWSTLMLTFLPPLFAKRSTCSSHEPRSGQPGCLSKSRTQRPLS